MNSNANRRKSQGIALLILGVVLLGIGLMAFIGVQSDLKSMRLKARGILTSSLKPSFPASPM